MHALTASQTLEFYERFQSIQKEVEAELEEAARLPAGFFEHARERFVALTQSGIKDLKAKVKLAYPHENYSPIINFLMRDAAMSFFSPFGVCGRLKSILRGDAVGEGAGGPTSPALDGISATMGHDPNDSRAEGVAKNTSLSGFMEHAYISDLDALGDGEPNVLSSCKDIYFRIISNVNASDIVALSCASKNLNKVTRYYCPIQNTHEFSKICDGFNVINTKPGSTLPHFNYFGAIKKAHVLNPYVENKAGCTFVIMSEGLTWNEVMKRLEEAGIEVGFDPDSLSEYYSEVSVDYLYGVVITNSIFEKSRSTTLEQQQKMVKERGCRLSDVIELLVLCGFIFKNSEGKTRLYSENPALTFGRTSHPVAGLWPVVVGFCNSNQLIVLDSFTFNREILGTGGSAEVGYLL